MPVGYTDDPFEALRCQDDLQIRYTGVTVLHLYMQEQISSPDACRKLVKTALTHFRLPYLTVTPTFSICPKHGYLAVSYTHLDVYKRQALVRGTDVDKPRNLAKSVTVE